MVAVSQNRVGLALVNDAAAGQALSTLWTRETTDLSCHSGYQTSRNIPINSKPRSNDGPPASRAEASS